MEKKPLLKTDLKILCLEDSPADAELMKRCLIKEDFNVDFIIVSSEDEFTSNIQSNSFDIILSDYNLPGFGGMEALKIARQICPDIPYIFVSGVIGEDIAVELLKYGASDYVLKDKLEKLSFSVNRALHESEDRNARKEAEKENAKLLQAIEQSPVCIVITDIQGNIEYANPKTFYLTGYTSQELLGKNPRILSSGESPKEMYKILWDTISSGKQWQGEFHNKTKTGELYWESANISPIFDNQGNIVQYLAVKENITEQKKAEKVLLESEERFRLLFDLAPIGYQSLDADGFIRDVNHTWMTMFGYTKKEVTGKWFGEFLSSWCVEIFEKRILVLKNEGKAHCNLEMICKDGSKLIISFNSSIVNTSDWKFNQIHCALSDITDQQKSEQIIQQQIRELTAIYKASQRLQKISNSGLLVKELLAVLKETVEFNYGGVLLLEGNQLVPFALTENTLLNESGRENKKTNSPITLSLRRGISGKVAQTGQSMRIGNVHDFPGYIEVHKEVNSELCVPLKADESVIGVINIESVLSDAFSESDQRALEIVAAQITIAIQNARLLEQLLKELSERKRAELELETHRNQLEDTVRERTEEFRQANEELKKEILNRKIIENQLVIFQQMIDSANQGFCLIKPDRRISYMNKRLIQMLEIKDWDQEKNLRLNSFISEQSFEKIDTHIWRTILREKEWSGELEMKSKKGILLPALVSFFALVDSNAVINYFAVIITDISQQKLVEQELTKAKEKAIEANSLKSTFLANMSHEIRTPMNAMLGYSEILSNSISDPVHKSYLESIRSSGKTLLNLINDILDLSKIEAGKLEIHYERVNLKSLVEEIVQMYNFKIKEKGIKLVHRISEHLPETCMLDELRVRQILMNLISNAIKFTEKGYVRIAVEPVNNGEKITEIRFIVEDTGTGISEQFLKHIFEPFTQQDEQDTKKYGGTGLGLAITRRLIELMNGEITIKSKLNSGSRFTVTLKNVKISDEKIMVSKQKNLDPSTIIFKPSEILVVDDVETNRNIIREYLKLLHFKVFEAPDGPTAIEMIKIQRFDLIFMDIRLPGMDGYEITRIIKKELNINIPIIALTASAFKEDEEKIYKAGMDGYLRKPAQMAEIIEALSLYIPYNLTEPKISNQEYELVLTNQQKENIGNAVMQIQKDVIPIWTQLKTIQPRNIVMQFVDKLIQISEQYQVATINEYAQSVKLALESFNIKEVRGLIINFPKFVSDLENITVK